MKQIVVSALIILLTGCSTSYTSEWTSTAKMKQAQAGDYRGCLGNARPWVLGGMRTTDLMFAGYAGTNSVFLQQPGLNRHAFSLDDLSKEDIGYLEQNFPRKR